jgi:TolA-binding protein
MKSVKMFDFDAKVQFNSNEISEETYQSVKKLTNEYIEHIIHETAEIKNMQRRIADLNLEVQQATEFPGKQLEESAKTYLDSESGTTTVLTKLPEVPTEPIAQVPEPEPEPEPEPVPQSGAPFPQAVSSTPISEPPQTPVQPEEKKPKESDWLTRMQAQ